MLSTNECFWSLIYFFNFSSAQFVKDFLHNNLVILIYYHKK